MPVKMSRSKKMVSSMTLKSRMSSTLLAALSAATNVDDILDFSVVDDTIQLDRDIFTSITVDGTLAAGAFHAGTAAADADDRIVYNAATGEIFYDADGVGGAAQILFATVNAGTALTNADFVGYI